MNMHQFTDKHVNIFAEKHSVGVFAIAQKSFGLRFYFFCVKLAWTQGMYFWHS